MRLSNRFGWTFIGLAIPLVHCATGEPAPTDGAGRAGSSTGGGFSNSGSGGGSAGMFAASGNPSFAGSGVGATGGKSVFGGSGMTGEGGDTSGSGTGGAVTSGSGGKVSTGGAPASCMDTLKNGSETDRDCGGATCDPCGEGLGCKAGTDCVSGQCRTSKCTPDHCGDMMMNEDETDVDCGGTCAPCAIGKGCAVPTDCDGRNCETATGKCGTPNHCVFGWRDDPCGMTCLTQTQSNSKRCDEVLDCYVENDCSPTTCGQNDQACGGNTLKADAAPFIPAKTVYDCLCTP